MTSIMPATALQVWDAFTPNSSGYQSRVLPGLDERYFVAQQSPHQFDIVEAQRGTTRASVKAHCGNWQLRVEGLVRAVGDSFLVFYPVHDIFPTPQAACRAWNRILRAWEHPAAVSEAEYIYAHPDLDPETARDRHAQAVRMGRG